MMRLRRGGNAGGRRDEKRRDKFDAGSRQRQIENIFHFNNHQCFSHSLSGITEQQGLFFEADGFWKFLSGLEWQTFFANFALLCNVASNDITVGEISRDLGREIQSLIDLKGI